jgi:hypothetical protein
LEGFISIITVQLFNALYEAEAAALADLAL